MAKVNFKKVEDEFDKGVQKLFIDNLAELATIANLTQDPKSRLSSQEIEEIIIRFRKELEKLKKQNVQLYEMLNLTQAEEERFAIPSHEFMQQDWLRLKDLKLRIDELKRELHGKESTTPENVEANESIVTKERQRHINKRFNVRDDWLPLH